MPKRKECPSCGVSFTYNRREPKMCPSCTQKARNKRSSYVYRRKTVNCEHCGKAFDQEHGRQKYCSVDCRKSSTANMANKRLRDKTKNKSCEICGASFRPSGRQLVCDKCLPEIKMQRSHGKLYCCVKYKVEFRTFSKDPISPQLRKDLLAETERKRAEAQRDKELSAAIYRMQRASYVNFNKPKAKHRIEKRGLEHDLSFDEFIEIKGKPCVYCGEKYCYTRKDEVTGMEWKYNTIDRIDPNKGYTKENCVPCCHKCNSAKSDFTLEEFKDHVRKMFDHMGLGQYPTQL